jgi:putative PIN family toxin of toxin-antitoxin system
VVDTNVVVSALLFPGKIPSRALLKAQAGIVLASSAMREELAEVMNRSRFDRYVEPEIRRRLVAAYLDATVMVEIPHAIRACRDPRDDKFLEAAVHGRADLILTGDADLLALHPFRGISIVTPAEFLERA